VLHAISTASGSKQCAGDECTANTAPTPVGGNFLLHTAGWFTKLSSPSE
jgi:hypothetical protein